MSKLCCCLWELPITDCVAASCGRKSSGGSGASAAPSDACCCCLPPLAGRPTAAAGSSASGGHGQKSANVMLGVCHRGRHWVASAIVTRLHEGARMGRHMSGQGKGATLQSVQSSACMQKHTKGIAQCIIFLARNPATTVATASPELLLSGGAGAGTLHRVSDVAGTVRFHNDDRHFHAARWHVLYLCSNISSGRSRG